MCKIKNSVITQFGVVWMDMGDIFVTRKSYKTCKKYSEKSRIYVLLHIFQNHPMSHIDWGWLWLLGLMFDIPGLGQCIRILLPVNFPRWIIQNNKEAETYFL